MEKTDIDLALGKVSLLGGRGATYVVINFSGQSGKPTSRY